MGWNHVVEYLHRVVFTPFYRLDWWSLVGFLGQGLFFLRFVVQWWASEKKQRTVIPVAFWYLSLAGSAITLMYAIHKADLVFILAFSLNILIYLRNLYILLKRKRGAGAWSSAATAQASPEKPDEPPAKDDRPST